MDAAMHTGAASTFPNPLSGIVQRRLDTDIDPSHAPAMPNRPAYPRYDYGYDSGYVTYEER
jgi:hypothetical protein